MDDPVAVHTLNEAGSIFGNLVGVFAKLEMLCEAVNVDGGVEVWYPDVEDANEAEEGLTESKDVDLGQLAMSKETEGVDSQPGYRRNQSTCASSSPACTQYKDKPQPHISSSVPE